MVGHPFANSYAHGCNFTSVEPDARLPGTAFCFQTIVFEGLNEDVFEASQVRVQVFFFGKANDGVANDLPWAMVGDVTSAICFNELNACFCKTSSIAEQVLVGLFPEA